MRPTVILLLACAACAPRTTVTTVTTATSTVESVQVAQFSPSGSLAAFVAAVPAFEGGGECATYPVGSRRMVVLSFAGAEGAKRNVALTVDAGGKLLSYSDARGDLEMNGTGPRTVVTVGFDGNTSTASNEHGGSSSTPGMAAGTAAEGMDLENLGTPRRMMEMVKQRCLGGGN
jgi:hypothetical protein